MAKRTTKGNRPGSAGDSPALLEGQRIATLVVALLLLFFSPAQAMRIVSLAPSVTETLFAIGAGPEVVGVSSYCDYPPQVAKIDRVGTFLTPSIEVILAKRPDLVIGVPTPGNRSPVESLERLGLKVLIVDPETVNAIDDSIVEIADAVGHGQAGRDLVKRIHADMAATRRQLDGAPVRRVLMVVGHTPLVAVGGGVFQDELIRMAHGVNLAASAGGQWPNLSLEWVVAQKPEVIIDATMGDEARSGAEAASFWSTFPMIPAVRDKRVYGYRDYAMLRPGPRIAEGFRTIAAFIQPEKFEGAAASEGNGERKR